MTTADEMYTRARDGHPSWIRHADGSTSPLPVEDWLGGDALHPTARAVDDTFVGQCHGPTLDLGCGPGRLVEVLTKHGIPALGVDRSTVAVAMTRDRGAAAIRRDIFRTLPGEGRWSHVLLADGNIGIGADPHRLLTRAAQLLCVGGTAIVEFGQPGTGRSREAIRIESHQGAGRWFPWARVAVDHADELAEGAGLAVRTVHRVHGRYVVEIDRR